MEQLNKLSTGERVVAASGILLLVFSFFKWYEVEFKIAGVTVVSETRNGWGAPDAFFSIVAILLGIVMAAHIISTKLAGMDLPERLGSVGWGVFHLAGGTVAFVFVLLKLLMNTDFTAFGIYIGLLCSAGLMVGGYLMARERGDLPEALGGSRGSSGPGGSAA